MHHRIGKLHLRLHAGCTHNPEARGSINQVIEKCGLADSGLTPDHQRAATAAVDRIYQLIEGRTFGLPAQKGDTTRRHDPGHECLRSSTPLPPRTLHADSSLRRSRSPNRVNCRRLPCTELAQSSRRPALRRSAWQGLWNETNEAVSPGLTLL